MKDLKVNNSMGRESGFSLVNTMVALGIGGVLMLVLSQLTSNTVNSQRFVVQKQESFTQFMSATGLLSDRSTCESNFKNQGFGPAPARITMTNLGKGGSNPPILTVGTNYGNDSIRLERMELGNFRPYTGGGNLGTAELIIEFSGIGSGLSGRSIGQVILLGVEVVGGVINTCIAIGNDLDDVWRRNAANQLFYTGTYVGIGTDSPEEMLHVNGNILAQAFLHDSDINLKENISEIKNIDDFESIRGVRFNWIDSGKPSIGVIAQEVEKVFPEVVHTSKRSGLKRVAYDQLIAPLIQYNKSLRKQLNQLEEKQKELELKLRNFERTP